MLVDCRSVYLLSTSISARQPAQRTLSMSQPPPVYPSWQEGQGSAARYDDSGDRGLLSNVLGGSTSGQQNGDQGYPPQQGYGGNYGQSQPSYGRPGYDQPGNTIPRGGYTSSGLAPPSGGYNGQSFNPSQGQPYAPPQQGYGGYHAPPSQQNAHRVQPKHHNLAGPALAALGGAAVGAFAEHEHDKHRHHHRHD